MRKLAIPAGLVAALAAFPLSPALGHGAIRFEQEACVLKVGPDFMYFSGYQPAISQKKFCEDIPEAGDTIFVLDYAQDELRKMTADFRIIRRIAQEEEEQARLKEITVAYLPPRSYPSGTLNFQHDFKETGDYVGIVTVDGPGGEHWVSRFPFSVGHANTPRTPYYLLTAAAVLGFLLLFWGKDDKQKRAPS